MNDTEEERESKSNYLRKSTITKHSSYIRDIERDLEEKEKQLKEVREKRKEERRRYQDTI